MAECAGLSVDASSLALSSASVGVELCRSTSSLLSPFASSPSEPLPLCSRCATSRPCPVPCLTIGLLPNLLEGAAVDVDQLRGVRCAGAARVTRVAGCLAGRARDRDDCAAGWELVAGDAPLSAHFFLGDYGLRRGDVVHAVVRRE